jgi:GTP-binding protein
MDFQSAKFITSAPSIKQCPEESLPEFCFAGRSNVGKSSLINRLANKKRLARTSNTPGKTQQMNYYRIGDSCFFVDLPGFGFAKVPQKERERWGKDILEYLLKRKTLKLIFHLVDSRHQPTKLDEDFFYWMGSNGKPFAVILTKSDKLSANKLNSSVINTKRLLNEMNIEVPVLACSAESGTGTAEVQQLINEFLNLE